MNTLNNFKYESYLVREQYPIREENFEKLCLEYKVNRLLYADEASHELDIMYKNIHDKEFRVFNPDFKQMLILLRIDYNISNYTNNIYGNIMQYRMFINKLFKEINDEHFTIVNDIKQINMIFVIFSHQDIQTIQKTGKLVSCELFPRIARSLNNNVSMAMSSIEDLLSPGMFLQTKTMLNMRFIYGKNHVYKYDEIKLSDKFKIPEKKVTVLNQSILTRNMSQVHKVLEDIFKPDFTETVSTTYHQYMYLFIVNIIVKMCISFDINIDSILRSELISESTFEKFDDHMDIVNHICGTLYEVYKKIDSTAHIGKDIVCRVRDHIEKNYRDEFRLTLISKTFAIHPNYLSTLFHSHVGKTIVTFLTEVRIQNACILLKETNSQIKEIAQEVGYQDIHYFYKIFKKLKGVTPLEYRNSSIIAR